MTPQVNCSLVERWIDLSLDGELSDDQELHLDEHLDECAECRARFDDALADRRLIDGELQSLSGAFDELLSERMTESTIARFEQESASDAAASERAKLGRSLRRAAAIVVIGVGLFVGLWAMSQRLSGLGSTPKTLAVAWWPEGETPLFTRAGGSTREPAGTHCEITNIDTVEVRDRNQLHVRYPDGSVATVVGPSRIELRQVDGRRHFRLLDGIAEFWIEPNVRGFHVTTRLAMIRVVGTQFTVEHSDEADKTGVLVEEGIVRTACRTRPEGRLELTAGDVAWVSEKSIQMRQGLLEPDSAAAERKPNPPESVTSAMVPSEAQAVDGPSDSSRPARKVPSKSPALRGLDVPVK